MRRITCGMLLWALYLLLPSGLFGMGQREGTVEDDDILKIGVTIQTMQVPVYHFMKEAALAKAGELGNIEIYWRVCEFHPDVQIAQVEDFIARGIDVLVIEPAETSSAFGMVETAQRAGIPVINLEAKIADAVSDLRIVADSELVGRLQVEEFMKTRREGEPINAVILSGSRGDEIAESITRGNLKALEGYPEIQVKVHRWHEGWDRPLALESMEDALGSWNNDIQVVFANNDNMALGALKAAENAGVQDKIFFVGADFDEEAAEIILRGEPRFLTIYKGSSLQGDRIVTASLNLHQGNAPPFDELVDGTPVWYTPVVVVDSSSVESLIRIKYPRLLE